MLRGTVELPERGIGGERFIRAGAGNSSGVRGKSQREAETVLSAALFARTEPRRIRLGLHQISPRWKEGHPDLAYISG